MKTTPAGISTLFVEFAKEMSTTAGTSSAGEEEFGTNLSTYKSLVIEDGKVLMEAVFADISAAELALQLDAAGIEWRNKDGEPLLNITSFITASGSIRTFLSGFLAPDDILALPASVTGVGGFVSAVPIGFQTGVGATTSQGDVAQNSDDARTQFGVDGTGITIGALSDSFGAEQNAEGTPTATTVQEDIDSGDLPANGVTVLLEGNPFSPDGDEGRAMLQLIHDVAPGADLAFHTADGGQGVFAQGILDLRNIANADVIVDDIIYFAEPIFQDGIIAQAVDQVVADGAVYLSSAGNNGDDGFLDTYRDSGTDGSSITALTQYTQNTFEYNGPLGNLHDWNPDASVTSLFVELTLPDGEDFTVSFQFDEPYGSAGGAGSTADYDIFITLYDPLTDTESVVDAGFSDNIGTQGLGEPIEIAGVTNDTGDTQTYRIYIAQFDPSDIVTTNLLAGVFFGSAGGSLQEVFNPQIVSSGGDASREDAPQFGAPTVFGHTNAAGALGVGASAWFNSPEFGLNPARLNGFSSESGFDILYDALGNRLTTPDVRDGVDFVAPDGGNTTFFGSDSGADADSFPNFFGTSAAAPHAAAVVALMLELNSTLTPAEVEVILESSGRPITQDSQGRPVGAEAVGAGLIDAPVALAGVPILAFGATTGDDFILANDDPNEINGLEGNDTIIGAGGNDTINGGEGNDSISGGFGDDLLVGDPISEASAVVSVFDFINSEAASGADLSLSENDPFNIFEGFLTEEYVFEGDFVFVPETETVIG